MADDNANIRAREIYNEFAEMLDERGWKYDKEPEDLILQSGAQGDGMSFPIIIKVNPELRLVSVVSPMPYVVPANKLRDVAVAVTQANYRIVDGSFDFDTRSGRILFRLTASYYDTVVAKDMFEYMLFVSCSTIDKYIEKFLNVTKRNMKFDEIVKYIC